MITFPISHPKIKIEIRLEEIDRLHLHEETIPERTNWLTEKIKLDGCFKHPIIVDADTLVVLDGTHRIAASRNLGYRFIPICTLDYHNPNVLIGCWYRTVDHHLDIEKILDLINELSFAVDDCSRNKATELVTEREVIAAIVSHSRCFTIRGDCGDIKETYDAIKRIEQKLKSGACSIGYEVGKDALKMVSSENIAATLMVPTVTKDEVLGAGLSGNVFNHKTTRHVIPVMPLSIDVPLELLSEPNFEEANKFLVDSLSKRRIKRLPPGQVLGHFYQEEIYLFNKLNSSNNLSEKGGI